MCSFEFNNIDHFTAEKLSRGAHLWIWYADKIPPHIGFSIEGSYYSLKYNGKDFGLYYEKALQVIHSRRIPSVFIQLNGLISKNDVLKSYSIYSSAKEGEATCLTPLLFLFNFPKCHKLSELLNCLVEENSINYVSGVYLPEGYRGISSYGVEEIQNRLRSLENAKIKKHISPLG